VTERLHSNGSAEEKLRLMFRMYDKDGNGSIDGREMNQ
jgi:Ca2+-binding EF-hand superfamily protein